MNPLTIDQIIAQIKGALDQFAIGIAATTSIALDPFNVFDRLKANTQGYLLILNWAGDENIATEQVCAITILRHRIEVYISFNLGMTANPSAALINQVGTRPPLFSQVDNLRGLMLGLQFPAGITEQSLIYLGAEPVVAPEGMPLAAYKLNFALIAAAAQPTTATQLPTT